VKTTVIACALLLAASLLSAWIECRQESGLELLYQGKSYNLNQADLPPILAALRDAGIIKILEKDFVKTQAKPPKYSVAGLQVSIEMAGKVWVEKYLPQTSARISQLKYAAGDPWVLIESSEWLPETPGLGLDPATHRVENLKLEALAFELKKALALPQTVLTGDLSKLNENNRILVREGSKLRLYRLSPPQTQSISISSQDEALYDWLFKKYNTIVPGRPKTGQYTIPRKRWDGNETTASQVQSALVKYLKGQGVDNPSVKGSDITIDKKTDPEYAIITVKLSSRTRTTRTRLSDEFAYKGGQVEYNGKTYKLNWQNLYEKYRYRIEIRMMHEPE